MADTGAVRVQGLRELRAELAKLNSPDEWQREFRQAGLDAAGIVAEEARRRVPVLSGDLKASIRPGVLSRSAFVAAGSIAWFSVPYAGVIEFGWPRRHIRAQPYLYPAAEAKHADVAVFYLQAVDRLCRRAFPEP
jgi:hypothetical protein